MALNKNPDFEITVSVLNRTGILLFVRVDEFTPGEASISIDLAQLPPLEVSTQVNETIEQGTAFCIKVYPNEVANEFYTSHRIILKDEEAISMFSETETDKETGALDITYTMKPKYTPAVTDDDPKM